MTNQAHPSDMEVLVERLRGLLSDTSQSPLPWRYVRSGHFDSIECDGGNVASFELDDDAQLAVEAVNALPDLLDALSTDQRTGQEVGADHYVEKRLGEGGLRLVSGSPTMLQDEFERFERERLAASPVPVDATGALLVRAAFMEALWAGWNSGSAGEGMDDEYAEKAWEASDAVIALHAAPAAGRAAAVPIDPPPSQA